MQQFLILFLLKLAYCPNGKTGTSTWMHYFSDLTNLPSDLKQHWNGKNHVKMRLLYNLPKELSYKEKLTFLAASLKVTFVRHPFVRLVSTYQDKLVDHDYRGWRNKCLKFPSNKKASRNIPNFDQFVQCTLAMDEKNVHDPHIELYWKKCDMCNLHYDVIGKLETYREDISYIFFKVNLPALYRSCSSHTSFLHNEVRRI